MSTPLEMLFGRLTDAPRKTARGWQARCPGHVDKSPSLSIAMGADGRILLRCFAGCGVDRIVAALGLGTRDLFPQREGNDNGRRRERLEPTRSSIADEISREAEAFRAQNGIEDGADLLTSEKNRIRQRVSTRLGITLKPIPVPVWEGNYGGRERDPLWALLFERAWDELWFARGTPPPSSLRQYVASGRCLAPSDLIFIEERAAEMLAAYTAAHGATRRHERAA